MGTRVGARALRQTLRTNNRMNTFRFEEGQPWCSHGETNGAFVVVELGAPHNWTPLPSIQRGDQGGQVCKMRQGDSCRERSEEGLPDEEKLSQRMRWLKNPDRIGFQSNARRKAARGVEAKNRRMELLRASLTQSN